MLPPQAELSSPVDEAENAVSAVWSIERAARLVARKATLKQGLARKPPSFVAKSTAKRIQAARSVWVYVGDVPPAVAPAAPGVGAAAQPAAFETLAAEIVEATPMRTLDERRAALYAKNVEAVFSGTEWLTAEEVGQLRQPGASNPYAAAARWRTQGRIFGVQRQGRTYYPRYLFTETWGPIYAVATLLKIFAGYSDMRIASWFESTNSYLMGKRPREVLATAPHLVVKAAQEHVAGIAHG